MCVCVCVKAYKNSMVYKPKHGVCKLIPPIIINAI